MKSLILFALFALSQPACAQEDLRPPLIYQEIDQALKVESKKYPMLYSQVSSPPEKIEIDSTPGLTNSESLEAPPLIMKNPVYDPVTGKRVLFIQHPWIWMDGQKLEHPKAWNFIQKRVIPTMNIAVAVTTLIFSVGGAIR